NHAQRNAFIATFVHHYNRTRLRCLAHKAPAELLANLPGHNTFAGKAGRLMDRDRACATAIPQNAVLFRRITL
ncbi:MAG TPA: hypothetical protein VFQ82_02135, partial [Stellaceae bacterium]|nr:hypothetical protein [Stellaceae bacterium]